MRDLEFLVGAAECSFTVGQIVIVKDDGDDDCCPRVAKFLGKEARVIGICNDIHGDPVVTIHHETLGYLTLQSYAFAPL